MYIIDMVPQYSEKKLSIQFLFFTREIVEVIGRFLWIFLLHFAMSLTICVVCLHTPWYHGTIHYQIIKEDINY